MPENFIARPLRLDDAQEFVNIYDAEAASLGYRDKGNVQEVLSGWQEPDFDLETSSQAVFTHEGKLIAYAVIWDTHEVPVHPFIPWTVHPDYRHLNIEKPLLDWVFTTGQRVLAKVPADVRVSLRTRSNKLNRFHQEKNEESGFVAIRSSYTMRIDMQTSPSSPTFPEGIHVRTYRHPQDLRELAATLDAGFSDHFGHIKGILENEIDYWKHEIESDSLFDEGLFLLAIDMVSQKMVGVCLGRREAWGNPDVGSIMDVTVLREYRKRGIAYALLLQSFGEFWKRGQKSVSLGVDAASLTGAVRLYERAGMYIDRQYILYEKVLRDGTEIETTSA